MLEPRTACHFMRITFKPDEDFMVSDVALQDQAGRQAHLEFNFFSIFRECRRFEDWQVITISG